MEKIKCMMKNKEMKTMLLLTVGVIVLCMIICSAKLACCKKKKECLCEEN